MVVPLDGAKSGNRVAVFRDQRESTYRIRRSGKRACAGKSLRLRPDDRGDVHAQAQHSPDAPAGCPRFQM